VVPCLIMPDNTFPSTSWSLIARAGEALSPDGKKALASLCEDYWPPVYSFVRRRCGSADEAHDRTQGFFAYLLEKNDLATVDRMRGTKFRAWLLTCVKNYLANLRDHENAKKRWAPLESLDAAAAEGRYQAETAHHLTPERLYARAFAMNVLARTLGRVRARYTAAGKAPLFDALKGSLTWDASPLPYEEVAALLGKTEGAVKKAAFDLRAHYKKELRSEVKRLVENPDDEAAVDKELRQLLAELEEPDE